MINDHPLYYNHTDPVRADISTFFILTVVVSMEQCRELKSYELLQLEETINNIVLLILLLLLLKKIGNARLGEGDCHPISPKTPAPHYQPIEEKKRKGK